MSKTTLVAHAPLVVIPGPDGDRYLYRGDTLPEDADPALVERLVERGLVAAQPHSRAQTKNAAHAAAPAHDDGE